MAVSLHTGADPDTRVTNGISVVCSNSSSEKTAEIFEQKLTGYRTLVLALGRYGISEQQIGSMTRTELDGYTEALARLHGKKTGQTTTRTTRTVKSQRRKKVGKRR